MQIIRLNSSSKPNSTPPLALTIGNFDGVHLGHQALIRQLQVIAKQKQLKTAILIFEPQPLEFLKPDLAPPRIYSLREKITFLRQCNIDYIIIAKFDDHLRNQTAEQFADTLKNKLNAKHLVLGDDFHFGKNRQGNSDFLRNYGLPVNNIETILHNEQRVSSTRIRQTLQAGDFQLAAELLGRPYSIIGRVVLGDQIGRTINFPTINVALKRLKPCLHGIYAVDVKNLSHNFSDLALDPLKTGVSGFFPNSLFGAGHVGTRPAIKQNTPQWRLEVHFPDFNANLYGNLVEVTFLYFLHGEKNYPNLDALQTGILQDVNDLCQYRKETTHFPFQHQDKVL